MIPIWSMAILIDKYSSGPLNGSLLSNEYSTRCICSVYFLLAPYQENYTDFRSHNLNHILLTPANTANTAGRCTHRQSTTSDATGRSHGHFIST